MTMNMFNSNSTGRICNPLDTENMEGNYSWVVDIGCYRKEQYLPCFVRRASATIDGYNVLCAREAFVGSKRYVSHRSDGVWAGGVLTCMQHRQPVFTLCPAVVQNSPPLNSVPGSNWYSHTPIPPYSEIDGPCTIFAYYDMLNDTPIATAWPCSSVIIDTERREALQAQIRGYVFSGTGWQLQ